ncbi:hypothetical protein L195_g046224, partial [Trifolium pratense]
VVEFYHSFLCQISEKMVPHINVLASAMHNWVLGELYGGTIVTMDNGTLS